MHPQRTNIQCRARDAHEPSFASAGALAFANEHSGSAALPAPSHAFAERKHAYSITPLLHTLGGDTCNDYRTKHVLPSPEKSYNNLDSPPQSMC
jgi:hypothetical protein